MDNGIPAGKTLGNILNELFECVLEDPQMNSKEKLLEVACKRYGSSKAKLRSIITSIKLSKDTELLYALISNMISYWIITEKQTPNTIHSKSFIIICSKAYSISNTQNTYILNIKDALSKLVDKYGMEYINSKRKTTIVEYKNEN